jgi:lipoprotein-anchoring transpeptidase ErfK/SrfK
MRIIMRILLALGLVIVAEGRALAYVAIDVDLSSQTMRVHSAGGETYVWPISSGRDGHSTPRGVFHPQRLYAMAHSAKYGNAPMPHSIFFHGQYAIHGTTAVGSLGSPASHGCIRLSPAHAAILFAMVQSEGAQIRIEGSAHRQVAQARRHHGSDAALAFAPVHRAKTLDQWAKNPVGR